MSVIYIGIHCGLWVCFVVVCFFSFCMMLCVGCFGGTVLYVCIEYHIEVNMYHVRAQGVDERIINAHNYYHFIYIIIMIIYKTRKINYIYITRKITYL